MNYTLFIAISMMPSAVQCSIVLSQDHYKAVFFPIMQSIMCTIGRIHNGFKVVFCFGYAIASD